MHTVCKNPHVVTGSPYSAHASKARHPQLLKFSLTLERERESERLVRSSVVGSQNNLSFASAYHCLTGDMENYLKADRANSLMNCHGFFFSHYVTLQFVKRLLNHL